VGLFSRKRFVVATILIGVEGPERRRIFEVVSAGMRRIVESEGDFDVTGEEVARISEVLLEYETGWSHVANWGEVFHREEDAAQYGEECFADCAGRYLSETNGSGERDFEGSTEAEGGDGHAVVMLTIAYEGEDPALEKTIATRSELAAALSAVVALHRRDRLLLAHVHQSPGTPSESLNEDQLLVSYPEMVTL
jgi:hypothetical protein